METNACLVWFAATGQQKKRNMCESIFRRLSQSIVLLLSVRNRFGLNEYFMK